LTSKVISWVAGGPTNAHPTTAALVYLMLRRLHKIVAAPV
jgi:hypothetical protein